MEAVQAKPHRTLSNLSQASSITLQGDAEDKKLLLENAPTKAGLDAFVGEIKELKRSEKLLNKTKKLFTASPAVAQTSKAQNKEKLSAKFKKMDGAIQKHYDKHVDRMVTAIGYGMGAVIVDKVESYRKDTSKPLAKRAAVAVVGGGAASLYMASVGLACMLTVLPVYGAVSLSSAVVMGVHEGLKK